MSTDKENISKRSKSVRKSTGVSKQVLMNSEAANSSELTNEFAGYLDYVRTLQGENENLKSEKESLIESCKHEICTIKSTYGCEIDALRKALDETTKEKCTIEYHNEKLLEENNNLKIKFARKIDAMSELEKKFEEAEACLIKNRKCVDQYDMICQEHEDVIRSNSLLGEQLKTEVTKRTDAESHILTLSDEIEFLKKVNSSNTIIRDNSFSANSKAETYYSEKFDEEMTNMRDELTEEFDQYKDQMEEAFKEKLEELTAMNIKINDKCTKLYNEKKALQNENDHFQAELADRDGKIASIVARDAKHTEIIAKLNKEHDDFIKDILEENSDLKEKLQHMNVEMTDLMNEKIANEKETYIFRSMLKGEQSRFNLSEITSPKKRKLEDDNDISAWSRGSMRIFCDENYNGNYVLLQNDGSDEINLNEWKIEIKTPSGIELLYTFPDRILGRQSSLRVWSVGPDVVEDGNNHVMNIELPAVNAMSCVLKNDMDENEATFELTKTVKRKILKANVKKPENPDKCSIM